MKNIMIGSDHAGFNLKEYLKKILIKEGYEVDDVGTHSPQRCDYPKIAARLSKAVSVSGSERGILVCKSGIGNSIAANRFPGVRAALCCNARAGRLSREHNDSNILVLGSSFVSRKQAQSILKVWLKTGFAGGRHQRRLNQIKKIEKQIVKGK
ncbi:MAG: ribose 5-phosphate isomerase B [Candidatus Omnitrophica bacterium]|nr:ribose 5-phosphate isomerase B [Candidatus Omnitrophota bacterium]MDD5654462.1 ribose 5-phosphate isomerase B [Candidatus Omnitrophota bacterium]